MANKKKVTTTTTTTVTEEIISSDQPVEIVAIIDRSGSMASIKNDAIGGFNAFIESQQALDGKANITTILFDDQYETLQDRIDVKEAVKLNTNNYVPRGSTALFDAIGKTIARFRELSAKGQVQNGLICPILTDGEENASTEYRNSDAIKKLIEDAEKELGWKFVFLSAGKDAFNTATSFGISGANTKSFVANSAGTQEAYRSMNAYASDYRTVRSNYSVNDVKDKDTQSHLKS